MFILIVVVTGAAGFIGSQLAENILQRGFTLVGIDNMNSFYDPSLKQERVNKLKERYPLKFDFYNSIDDFKDWNNDIGVIFHLAAQPSGRLSHLT
jgi:nucleoside-diphosphate-sugar epimerase